MNRLRSERDSAKGQAKKLQQQLTEAGAAAANMPMSMNDSMVSRASGISEQIMEQEREVMLGREAKLLAKLDEQNAKIEQLKSKCKEDTSKVCKISIKWGSLSK